MTIRVLVRSRFCGKVWRVLQARLPPEDTYASGDLVRDLEPAKSPMREHRAYGVERSQSFLVSPREANYASRRTE